MGQPPIRTPPRKPDWKKAFQIAQDNVKDLYRIIEQQDDEIEKLKNEAKDLEVQLAQFMNDPPKATEADFEWARKRIDELAVGESWQKGDDPPGRKLFDGFVDPVRSCPACNGILTPHTCRTTPAECMHPNEVAWTLYEIRRYRCPDCGREGTTNIPTNHPADEQGQKEDVLPGADDA